MYIRQQLDISVKLCSYCTPVLPLSLTLGSVFHYKYLYYSQQTYFILTVSQLKIYLTSQNFFLDYKQYTVLENFFPNYLSDCYLYGLSVEDTALEYFHIRYKMGVL